MEDNENYHLIESEGEEEGKKKLNKSKEQKTERNKSEEEECEEGEEGEESNNRENNHINVNELENDNINHTSVEEAEIYCNDVISYFIENKKGFIMQIIFGFLYIHPLLHFVCKKKHMRRLFSTQNILKMERIMIFILIFCCFISFYLVPNSNGMGKFLINIISLFFLFLHLSNYDNGSFINELKNLKNIIIKSIKK